MLTIIQPDDWHCHFRDDSMLNRTVSDQCRYFQRSIAMPNLLPPITQVNDALAYRDRILSHCPEGASFNPLMTLYLTASTTIDDVEAVASSKHMIGFKLYPKGATTNSQAGIVTWTQLDPIFQAMSDYQVPLLIHGEVTDPNIDIFDREAVFIDSVLIPLLDRFPGLPVVLEHITSKAAAEFVTSSPHQRLAATITPQHLLYDRNVLFEGGIQPDYYCLPILKRHEDQEALIQAATSGNPRFFLGTDSAPHTQSAKYTACGCAGIYSAHTAIPLYLTVFEAHHALDHFEGFASRHGATFYQLPVNQQTIQLVKRPWQVPEKLSVGNGEFITPLGAGQCIEWRLHDN